MKKKMKVILIIAVCVVLVGTGITLFFVLKDRKNGPVVQTGNGSLSVEWTGNETTEEKKTKIEQAFTQASELTPKVTELSDYNLDIGGTQIKAIAFDGMTVNGEKTKVFAYVAIPDYASKDNQVPGMVLIHGGGGHAFYQWVKKWTDKGYAAISLSTNGYFPVTTGNKAEWAYGLPEALKEKGYVNAPNGDSVKTADHKVDTQWIYNAVGQSILASNVLRSYEAVKQDWIGVEGISWGSVVSSVAIGYDTRFACSINIYGAGYLNENLGAVTGFKTRAAKELWLAQDRFDKVQIPVLWLCGNSDSNFSVNINSDSYKATQKANPFTTLSVVPNFRHSHGVGWARPEAYLFAEGVRNGTSVLSQFTSQPSGKKIACTFTKDESTEKVKATLRYLTQELSYANNKKINQEWKSAVLTVKDGKITGTVPKDAKQYYIELSGEIDGEICYTSSQMVVLQSK